MYSLKAILEKEPAAIASAVRAVLFLGVLLGVDTALGLALDEKILAGVALALEVVLGLFVRQTSTSSAYPVLKANTEVKVEGTTDTVIVQPTPPGPTGIPGDAP